MIRTPAKQAPDQDPEFTWRGEDVSRIENLSDIVFAFALTLLVVSAAPPATFEALTGLWREAISFACCFAILLLIWNSHYLFFRRYGLRDGRTVAINALLLFLVMTFIYPLEFLFTFLVRLATGYYSTWAEVNVVMSLEQAHALLIIYSLGYAAVFGVFALLYRHAWSHRHRLGFTDLEEILTREAIYRQLIHVAVAFIVILLTFPLPNFLKPYAGGAFFLIGVGEFLVSKHVETLRKTKGLA